MNQQRAKKCIVQTSLDDDVWETDPDYERNMDEISQRWGSTNRTVGSINMGELIDEVKRDNELLREKFLSSSDHSDGFRGKFGLKRDGQIPPVQEDISRHSSQEVSRKVISTSNKSSVIKDDDEHVDKRETVVKKFENMYSSTRHPPVAPKSAETRNYKPTHFDQSPIKSAYKDNLSAKTTAGTYNSSSLPRDENFSRSSNSEVLNVAKSLQDKIDAFKKEFEDIESKLAKKTDLSKVVKTTNVEKISNIDYTSRYNDGTPTSATAAGLPSSRLLFDNEPAGIKSLSQKFETLCRETDDDFKRRTDVKRREFFNEIKNQVRETRKGLEGFDPIVDSEYDLISRAQAKMHQSPAATSHHQYIPPSLRATSRSSGIDTGNSSKPKVFTRRETTQEEFFSRVVKENDKIVQNESKRNVERSSSCHGSSDEESQTSIRRLNEKLRTSPLGRNPSPVDEIKRKNPVVVPQSSGSGLMARTLYDYQADEDDELTFDKDDLICDVETIDKGWYKGTITKHGKKKVGLFPANHVKLL